MRSLLGSRGTLYLLFALSGTASLIYEVVWKRWLTDLLGSASGATATVLAVFMGGLGIGSWLAGRVADRTQRPIRAYALLEIGIVGLAMLPAWEITWLTPLFLKIAHRWGPGSAVLDIARFAAATIAIGPPAVLMGATFPLIVKALAAQRELLGKQTAGAYAANSFGGVCGTVLAGFFLIENLGLRGAGLVAAAMGASAGVLGLWLDRLVAKAGDYALLSKGQAGNQDLVARRKRAVQRSKPARDTSPAGSLIGASVKATPAAGTFWVLAAAAVSGFCALGYETIWFRVLSQMTLNTTYAFSLMLAILLSGLSVGSWLVRVKLGGINRPSELFAVLQTILAGYALTSLFWLPLAGELVLQASANGGAGLMQSWISGPLVLAICLLFVPAILMGASLPVACQLYAMLTDGIGRPVGHIYAANTLGSVLGSLIVGLVITPMLGTWWAVALCSLLGAVGVVGVALSCVQSLYRLAYVGAAVATIFAAIGVGLIRGGDGIGGRNLASYDKVIFRAEDAGGVVEVVEDSRLGTRSLLTNRLHCEGSTLPRAVAEQRKQGLLPLLLHPSPKRVLEIGLGTGIKLGALKSPLVERAVVVELSPAVVEASRWFADYNHDIAGDAFETAQEGSKVQIVCGDGRNFVALTPERFDVIINGLLTPYRAGVSRLYTVEYFQTCRQKLEPHGMFVAWVAIRQIAPDDLKVLVGTLLKVFPHTTMWLEGHYLALIAPKHSQTIDMEALQKRFDDPSLREFLEESAVDGPTGLLAMFVAGPEKLRDFVEGHALNTEDRPIIEFRTPKLGNQLDSQHLGAKIQSMLSPIQEPLCPKFVEAEGDVRRQIERAQEARWLARWALILKSEGKHVKAAKVFMQALARDPEDSLARFELEIYLVVHAEQCVARGRIAQARRMFQQVLEINRRSIGALAGLAAIEEARGNRKAAGDMWKKVRVIDPHNKLARRELAQLHGDAFRRH